MTPKEYYRDKQTGEWCFCVSVSGTHSNVVPVYSERLTSSEEDSAKQTETSADDSDSEFDPFETNAKKGKKNANTKTTNKRKGTELVATRRSKRRATRKNSAAAASQPAQQPAASSEDQQPATSSADQQPVASSADQQPAASSADQQPAASSANQQQESARITAPCHNGNPDDQTAVVQSHDQRIPANKLEARHVVHEPEKYCPTHLFPHQRICFIPKQICFHTDAFVFILKQICFHTNAFVLF